MSYEKIRFTKSWEDPADFPTIETSESQVRADIQLLFNEIANTYNQTIDTLTGTGEESGASGIGINPVEGITGTDVQDALDSIGETQIGLRADLQASLGSVEIDDQGVMKFIRNDGTYFIIDTDIEKIVLNFEYDADTESLVLTYPDGHTVSIPMSSFISEYDFDSSGTVEFTVTNHKVTANVKSQYMSEITQAVDTAKGYMEDAMDFKDHASDFADTSGGYADTSKSYAIGTNNVVRPSDSTDNAKYYSQQAGQIVQEFVNKIFVHAINITQNPNGPNITTTIGDIDYNSYSGFYSIRNKLVSLGYTSSTNYLPATGTLDRAAPYPAKGIFATTSSPYNNAIAVMDTNGNYTYVYNSSSLVITETVAQVGILSVAKDAETAAEAARTATTFGNQSKSYAVGDTGTREGEDTDNAKYYMERSGMFASDSSDYAMLSNSNMVSAKIFADRSAASAEAAATYAAEAMESAQEAQEILNVSLYVDSEGYICLKGV